MSNMSLPNWMTALPPTWAYIKSMQDTNFHVDIIWKPLRPHYYIPSCWEGKIQKLNDCTISRQLYLILHVVLEKHMHSPNRLNEIKVLDCAASINIDPFGSINHASHVASSTPKMSPPKRLDLQATECYTWTPSLFHRLDNTDGRGEGPLGQQCF